MIPDNSSKLAIDIKKELIVLWSSADRELSGMILMATFSVGSQRRLISVANLVHKLSFLGNGISVKASRRELFPAD